MVECNLYFICPSPRAAWTIITFFGDSVAGKFDKATNETYYVEIPRLPTKSFYPWNAMSGFMYIVSFVLQVRALKPMKILLYLFIYFVHIQVYFLLFSMCLCNLSDVMFCCWLIFACEQLQHLKVVVIFCCN